MIVVYQTRQEPVIGDTGSSRRGLTENRSDIANLRDTSRALLEDEGAGAQSIFREARHWRRQRRIPAGNQRGFGRLGIDDVVLDRAVRERREPENIFLEFTNRNGRQHPGAIIIVVGIERSLTWNCHPAGRRSWIPIPVCESGW